MQGQHTPKPVARSHHLTPLSGPMLAVAYPLACALPLLLALGRDVAPMDKWERAAAAMGMVALVALAIQFVSSGRFEAVSGRLGIDKIMAFHKIAALWVLIGLILHPLAFVLPTWTNDPALGSERLTAYLTLPHYRSGVVALVALLILVTSGILRDRLPWRYEIWRSTHIVLGVVAVGGGVHHALTTGRFSAMGPVYWMWWALALTVIVIMVILYVWRWALLHRHPWQLASIKHLADGMWELDIQPAPNTKPFDYMAGQFVWVTEGNHRFPLFDHPFSIADNPERPGLSLIIKEAGDFTNKIGDLAPRTPIGIDGPYGEFTLSAHQGDAILLLAGGVGIAPMMGLLRDLVARHDPRPVRLAYAAGRPANFACLPEIMAAQESLDLQIMLISEEDAEGWNGLTGWLTHDRLRALLQGLDTQQTVALICGPGPMVTAISDALLDLGLPSDKVIYERFDYTGGASQQDRRRAAGFVGIGAGLAGLVSAFALVK